MLNEMMTWTEEDLADQERLRRGLEVLLHETKKHRHMIEISCERLCDAEDKCELYRRRVVYLESLLERNGIPYQPDLH